MMRRLMMLATAVILCLSSTDVLAHQRFRIVGTVTKRSATELWVKTKENKTVGMDLDKKTVFLRDKTKIAGTAVKVGATVVVDAIGDDLTDLVAEQVRLVPAIPDTPAKKTPPPQR